MTINVHIGRLILEGVTIAPAQRAALQSALEIELGRLLARGGVSPELAKGGAVPRINVNPIQLPKGSSPAELGRQIAGSVYGGIGK